ncbi:MAG: hypothetical protein KF812_04095 [Fimbriimonadaceae bacterium]|nr:hypothetical protein [Fimbriimonadaceae bacterium]
MRIGNPRESFRRAETPSVPLRRRMLLWFGLLTLITALVVGGLAQWNSKRVADELLTELTTSIASQSADRTLSHLKDSEPALRLARSVVLSRLVYGAGDNPADPEIWQARARLLAQVLFSSPGVTQVYIADRQGFLVKVRRTGAIAEVETAQPRANRSTLWNRYELTAKGILNPLPPVEDANAATFDPRKRGWYQQAIQDDSVQWTDVYRFVRSEANGVTAAVRLVDPNGEGIVGVLAADIEVSDMNAYLAGIETAGSGRVYLLDGQGRVIAEPESTDSGDGLMNATDSPDSVLRAAASSLSVPDVQPHRMVRVGAKGGRYLAAAVPVPLRPADPWWIVVAVPEAAVAGLVQRQTMTTIFLSLLGLVVTLVAAWWLARRIAAPLQRFEEEMHDVGQLRFHAGRLPRTGLREIDGMATELERLKTSVSAFEKYVPPELVRMIHTGGRPVELGVERATVAVMFADIIGFSRLSQESEPEALTIQLADFYVNMEEVVSAQGGVVDKFGGDSVMALWGTPARPSTNPGRAAILAGLDYIHNQRAEPSKLHCGIGIHLGTAVVGNIGTPKRMNYTAIGDTVNLANRIEDLTRVFRVDLLVSKAAWDHVGDDVLGREIDTVVVRGRDEPVVIYQPLIRKELATDQDYRLVELYEHGLALYRRKMFEEAATVLADLLVEIPYDVPAEVLLKRCLSFQKKPPKPDWDGVTMYG